ncbi:MAG TPA: DUF1629 domain-containing protein [Steroidobacter sp.]|uniref:imm11 family protein n=1 Tax=Steroidobacter sp. TaxID=1978227 RepID=UPI002ED8BF38
MSELDIPKLPPDALALLDDPQLADLKYRGPGLARAGKVLEPSQPAKVGDSPFLILKTSAEYMRPSNVVWQNPPSPRGMLGEGRGFPTLRSTRPHFTEDQPKPAELSHAWEYEGWLVASPQFAATIRAFDPEAIETVEIEWVFADGQKLDGYVFLDVRRLLHAYDYRRSVVYVEIGEKGKYISNLGTPRALKPDLPANVHLFREAYWRHQVLVSRELAKALTQALGQTRPRAARRDIYFEDPARVGAVKF